ncbi:MAG: hypothetical protein LC789_07930 [Actinobacteria bacterium]|nr:hypothetical protein [Actinomycetota bacterium]
MKRLAVLLLAVVLLGCAPAWAEDAPPAASWSQLRRTTPLGDTPDVDGGLAVQNGPAGVAAYTAVRTAVFAKEAVLTLTLADGGSTQTPVVWACPATAAWQPGAGQAWEARPAYDCTQHAVGTVVGTSVSWELTPEVTAATGRLDVVLVPDPAATEPFAVSFVPPTAAAFSRYVEEPVPAAVAPQEQEQDRQPPPEAEAPAIVAVAGQPLSAAAPAPAAALPATVAGAPGQNPVVAQDSQPVATALAATRAPGSHRSVGAGLIALLALLLMVRTALPSKPLAAPTSLLRRPGRGSTSSPDL